MNAPKTEPQTNAAHTPGPWEITEAANKSWQIARWSQRLSAGRGDTRTTLAEAYGQTEAECNANARLIATAPDLLAALYHARAQFREVAGNWSALSNHYQMEKAWANVRAIDNAIAEAKGTL